ncbi:MAG: type II secretion system F family protein [Bdellovibrionales bacterium]|nr:type II secretion system F family protein [Bdellovibrionales bacterium]
MGFLISNEYILIPLFGLAVFIFSYLMSDRIIHFLHDKSLGSREEVLRLMDLMFVETDQRKVTIGMLLISFGLGSLVFLATWPNIVVGLIFGSVVTALGWTLPKFIVTSMWEKRCTRFTDQMVDGLTIMSNGVKAGLSITQSMERVCSNMSGPIVQEFNLVLNKQRLGMPLEQALSELGDRIPRQDLQMFVTGVNILKETGGNLAETFTTIVTVIRERQKIEKKISAMTPQGVMQAVIITLVPFILLGVFLVVDPSYVEPLFTKPLGWFALFLMLSLQVIGGVIMKKVVTIKV